MCYVFSDAMLLVLGVPVGLFLPSLINIIASLEKFLQEVFSTLSYSRLLFLLFLFRLSN